MAYWDFYLDHRKPVWQDFLAGALFPIMAPISILGAGCTDPNIKGDPLIPFPKTEPTGTDASIGLDVKVPVGPVPLDGGYATDVGSSPCQPDPCSGIVRGIGNRSFCLSFQNRAQAFGLLSTTPLNGIAVEDVDADLKPDVLLL